MAYINGKDTFAITTTLKGEDGKDGQTPFIGENGHWWIGDTDTGVNASGGGSSSGDSENITLYDNTGHGAGAKELFIQYNLERDTETIKIPLTHMVQVKAENERTWTEYDGDYDIERTYKSGKYTYKGNGNYWSIYDDSEYSGNIWTSVGIGVFTLVLDGEAGEYSLTFEGVGIDEENGTYTNINTYVTKTFEELWDWFSTSYHKY